MSTTQHRSSLQADGISEEAIAHYLETHPEFFERHAHLLARLRVPHQPGGSAVSLVERQVELLRQRNRTLDRRLAELVEVARSNDRLVAGIHRLALRLLGAVSDGLMATVREIEASLREEFGARQAVLVLFHPTAAQAEPALGRFLRVADPHEPDARMFDTFLAAAKPRCGQIRNCQRDYLFGPGTDEVGSVALVPLRAEAELGLLAIGSTEADHFHPGMSTDFLSRIGDLVSRSLSLSR